MATCHDCTHLYCCKYDRFFGVDEVENKCNYFKNKADFVEVVRCGQCQYAEELDKHCEINRNAYKHCSLWRGDETRNVWHKYKKYYRDYSIVEEDAFCSEGRRKEK